MNRSRTWTVVGALATVTVPSVLFASSVDLDLSDIQTGSTIDAAAMTARFEALEAAIDDNDARLGAVSEPCGATGPVLGDIGGYPAAKQLCTEQVACGATARVCSPPEVLRFVENGGDIDALPGVTTDHVRLQTGVRSDTGLSSHYPVQDCDGWTTAFSGTTTYSATWVVPDDLPNYGNCNVAWPVLCCTGEG